MMEKHTAKMCCLTIVLVMVGDTLGQANSTTVESSTTVENSTTPTPAATEATPPAATDVTTNVGITVGTTDAEGVTDGNQTIVETTKGDMTTAPAAVTGDKLITDPKAFNGKLRITHIKEVDAEFTDALENPKSFEFKNNSETVCKALVAVSKESTLGTVEECKVTSFTNGSIVANFYLKYAAGTSLTAEALQKKLKESFGSPSSNSDIAALTVDVDSITVEVAETEVTQPSPVGLSTGAIVGIAVGSAVGGLLLIGILVFVIIKCKGGSSKVTSSSTQELRPTAQQDAEAGHEDGVIRS